MRDVVAALENVTGNPLPVKTAPRRAGDPPSLIAKADAIRDVLGWQPRFDDLDLIVKTALAWEQYVSTEQQR